MRHADAVHLASLGIHLPNSVTEYLTDNMAARRNIEIAVDAQPSLVTVSNSGIPAFLTNFLDPKFVEVLLTPNKAVDILGSEKKLGDWTTQTATFPVIESTGETSGYGDFNNNGSANANVNFPQRQSFHYQVVTQWGHRELEMAGLAKIDWAARLNIAGAITLNKFQNKSYFFGIAGLQNYGLLNDPDLLAPIGPSGGIPWNGKDGQQVYADIALLFAKLVAQSGGIVEMDETMTLGMSPEMSVNLTKTNQYNVNVADMLKKNFPNLKVETAPEYSTDAGELLQLIAVEVEGQRTAEGAFTEKMRAHPVIPDLSSWKQKKSQGTWGTVIYRPFLIAQMLGV